MLRRTTLTTTAAIALAASLAGPAAGQDLRNPDNRASDPSSVTQDLRNADRRVAEPGAGYQDLRNPDTADAARSSGVVPEPVSTVSLAQSSGGGFDWSDAGIGAAGMLGLIGLAAGTALIGAHYRRRRFPSPSH